MHFQPSGFCYLLHVFLNRDRLFPALVSLSVKWVSGCHGAGLGMACSISRPSLQDHLILEWGQEPQLHLRTMPVKSRFRDQQDISECPQTA